MPLKTAHHWVIAQGCHCTFHRCHRVLKRPKRHVASHCQQLVNPTNRFVVCSQISPKVSKLVRLLNSSASHSHMTEFKMRHELSLAQYQLEEILQGSLCQCPASYHSTDTGLLSSDGCVRGTYRTCINDSMSTWPSSPLSTQRSSWNMCRGPTGIMSLPPGFNLFTST